MNGCKNKCQSCQDTQDAIIRMEKRLIRIEQLLKKQVQPQVQHMVRTDVYKIPQNLQEFLKLEEQLGIKFYF